MLTFHQPLAPVNSRSIRKIYKVQRSPKRWSGCVKTGREPRYIGTSYSPLQLTWTFVEISIWDGLFIWVITYIITEKDPNKTVIGNTPTYIESSKACFCNQKCSGPILPFFSKFTIIHTGVLIMWGINPVFGNVYLSYDQFSYTTFLVPARRGKALHDIFRLPLQWNYLRGILL